MSNAPAPIPCTPDPLVAGGGLTANPQSLDSFSYVLNNPLRYTDPTGLCFRNPVTGEMLHCSQQEAFEWTVCASSSENCEAVARNRGIDTSQYDWSEVSKMASCGIGSRDFKDSYAKHLSGADPQELEHYANPHGGYGYLLGVYYSTLVHYGFLGAPLEVQPVPEGVNLGPSLGDIGGASLQFFKEHPVCSIAPIVVRLACERDPLHCYMWTAAAASACATDISVGEGGVRL